MHPPPSSPPPSSASHPAPPPPCALLSAALTADVVRSLLESQRRLPVYLGRSPQLFARRYLVDWLAAVGGEHALCPTARCLAVVLLDYFMDRFDIQQQQLRLVALCCLLVAAKFEELEVHVPRCAQLNKYVPLPGYLSRDYLDMELNILTTFDWNIGLPTPAHFLAHYLDLHNADLDPGDDDDEKQVQCVAKFTDYFLEISMQDHVYRGYEPSRVAAACVAASRWCLHVEPLWTVGLEKCIGYSWDKLHQVVQTMLKTYAQDKEAETSQSRPDVS